MGLSTDKDQPIQIESDNMQYDDKAKVNVYKGNVVVTQGSMRLTGNVLTINLDKKDDITKVFVDGEPACFRQLPDGKSEYQEGEALRMEYHKDKHMIYFIKNARVTQGAQSFSGHEITYDTERNFVTARRANEGETPAKGAKPARVIVTIPPQNKEQNKAGAQSPSAPSASSTPAPASRCVEMAAAKAPSPQGAKPGEAPAKSGADKGGTDKDRKPGK
jgi:lipopolysaccharide export system protein LptA